MSRKLRVGVPPQLRGHLPHSSVDRVFSNVLRELGDLVELVDADLQRRRLSLSRHRPDVWLTDGHDGPLGVPEPVAALLHEADWEGPDTAPHLDPAFADRFVAQSRAGAAAASVLVTPSASSKEQIVRAYGIAAERVFVAPHGVDSTTFKPGLEGGARMIAAAGGNASIPYVLYVGVAHPRKNIAAVRDAVAALTGEGIAVSLALVAGPPLDRSDGAGLVTQAVASIPGVAAPVVNLFGIDDRELAVLMAGAAALASGSLMEGFGMPVLEAMACGTVVVVSDRGAHPEVVGDAGLLVAPTAEGIATGLREVLCNRTRAEELSRRAAERARTFRWQDTAATYAAALHRAAEIGATR